MNDLPSLLAGVAADLLSGKTAEQNKTASHSKYGFKAKEGFNIPFLTPKQLAQQLGVSEKTLERWRKDGSGPPFVKTGSKRIRYPIVGLEAWIEANLHQTNSDSQ